MPFWGNKYETLVHAHDVDPESMTKGDIGNAVLEKQG